ncbi:membrane protein [Nostoc linckia z16]|nr:membrane protein [Nostoc linckia z16]
MIRFFKIIATLEGISLLALLLIAMPLKYIAGNPEPVKHVGMAHGVLFIGYIIMAVMLKIEENWSWKKFAEVCVASVVPFGTFYIERKYFKSVL